MKPVIRTLSVRVRDKHAIVLNRMAFDANQVWNAANAYSDEFSWVPVPEVGYINCGTSAFELMKDLKGIRKERGMIIDSTAVQEVIAVHAKARKQFKKNKLNWRCSGGARRALGWVPFKSGAAKWVNGQIRYAGQYFKVWGSYGLSQFDFRSGCFSQDARGRWYFNIVVYVDVELRPATGGQIGIDLGLKTTATCSNGDTLARQDCYRNSEMKLGIAQRAKDKKRIKAIHAKIKHRRKDAIHKFSNKLVKENSLIVVGNVSASGLAKTKMAKSVLDAGWAMLKTQLEYKSIRTQGVFIEVNESYTTQACSCCGCISASSPKGRAGLGIREWTCAECGTTHDRDIHAAKNILALGHKRLAVGIPFL
ncbi:transposase [Methylobacter sp. G7]|uniref:RNA-guided endonuclease InsQ/TnpB family protein n=1 Tax=Methylobacter sp. G7 TaxID=3230117 RepID=UPI003D8007E4